MLRPIRVLLVFLAFLLFPGAVLAQDEEDLDAPKLLANEARLEGRIRSVSADLQSFELEVVVSFAPSGRRTLHGGGMVRQVRLGESCYIYDRKDRSIFFARRDLEAGKVVVVQGAQDPDNAVIAREILLGGELPKVKAPEPIGPDVDPGEIKLPRITGRLGKFEPVRGCYLGAFVMRDENVNGSMEAFEQRVAKGHASYLRYVGYGQPFPTEWVKQVRRLGAVPNIAFEPNDGLRVVRDDNYLRGFAKAAASSGGPVFLRWASEMNGTWTAYSGNPWLYRTKFRLVARVFRQVAPNVALVWTPYCTPRGNIPDYYPGDDAVDWVGVNVYSVHHHNGQLEYPAAHEDPTELLRPIYERYAAKKPIQISEYAATNFCKACQQSMPDFAVAKMRRLYASLPKLFPRVKMIYWFSWDTIAGGAAENNYAITGDAQVLESYRRLTASPYFLPRLDPRLTRSAEPVKREALR